MTTREEMLSVAEDMAQIVMPLMYLADTDGKRLVYERPLPDGITRDDVHHMLARMFEIGACWGVADYVRSLRD